MNSISVDLRAKKGKIAETYEKLAYTGESHYLKVQGTENFV